ncbi:MAG: hypothetical protein IJ412_01830 [Oscillospiraceae bacterium]|nr:hypothetical protein [Oscillospiraceae bacterium]
MAAEAFFIMWLALAVLSIFFAVLPTGKHRLCVQKGACGKSAAAVPLCTLCGMILVLLAFGCAGALRIGAWCILLCAEAAGVVLVVRRRRSKDGGFAALLRARCCTPAWGVCFGGSALLAVLLAVKQPLFTQWDEFSFWGTAAHAVWRHDALYTLLETTNLEARTYPPAAALLSYIFTFLSDTFAPWALYAAYGVLTFAVFGAVVGLAEEKKTAAAAFGTLLCVLAPFAVESAGAGQRLNAYATAYADHMLGVLTAGGCAVWLGSTGRRGTPLCGGALAAALAKTACVSAVLGLVKDVGLPLGLVVFLVCTADHFANDFLRYKKDGRAWLRLVCVGAVLAGTAVLSYMVWAKHLAAALDSDRSYAGGSAGLSTVGMLVSGIKELLGIGRTEHFSAVFSAMVGAFLGRRVSVFGSGILTAATIMGIFALAFALERKGQRRRVVCFAAASGIGFAGYYFFQLLCYVYVFSAHDGLNLVSYGRYMGIYYLFWLLGAVCALLHAAAGRRQGCMTVMACAALVLAACWLNVRVQDTFLGRFDAAWAEQTVIEERAQQALAAAGADSDDDRVLLVAQWDDGGRWYRYAYALEPLPLYHAGLDNTIVAPETEGPFSIRLDAQSIGGFLRKEGITLLLLDVVDYDFWAEFRPLFTDGMTGYEQGSCHVYRVCQQEDGSVLFVPYTAKTEAVHE